MLVAHGGEIWFPPLPLLLENGWRSICSQTDSSMFEQPSVDCRIPLSVIRCRFDISPTIVHANIIEATAVKEYVADRSNVLLFC